MARATITCSRREATRCGSLGRAKGSRRGMLGKVKDATGDTPKRERRRQVERRMGRRTGGGGREKDPRDLAPKWGRWRDHFSQNIYARLKSELAHPSAALQPQAETGLGF